MTQRGACFRLQQPLTAPSRGGTASLHVAIIGGQPMIATHGGFAVRRQRGALWPERRDYIGGRKSLNYPCNLQLWAGGSQRKVYSIPV